MTGCRLHGRRWWYDLGRYCRVCRARRLQARRGEWRRKTLDEKCAEMRARFKPAGSTRTQSRPSCSTND